MTRGYSLEFLPLRPPLTDRPLFTEVPVAQEGVLLQEISDLLSKNAIEEVAATSLGFYTRFFLVTKKDGGWRPVLNLKPLNRYLRYTKFTMETQNSILRVLSKGQWLATLV